jgi:hypothetical protein
MAVLRYVVLLITEQSGCRTGPNSLARAGPLAQRLLIYDPAQSTLKQGLHCGSGLRTDVSDNRRIPLAVALVYPLFATPTTGNSSRSQQQAFRVQQSQFFPLVRD